MNSTEDVLSQYVSSFGSGDLEGILSCYSPDAVLLHPYGVAKGTEAIRIFIRTVLAAFGTFGMSFELEQQSIEGEHGHIRWSASTISKVGCFTVRHGKIVSQSFTVGMASPSGCDEVLGEAAAAQTTAKQSSATCDHHAYASALESIRVQYPVPAAQRMKVKH